ncbi:site-specific integrase [Streptomyces sp. H10-C2]|uniref:site-specific integrase n=1 Tax=unclassified Streptomyces TaxID=2593676 RepID=UPI0024BB885C|nr:MULTISPECIES: site-specific integrase [unclassified Streptomyces]MDJ0345614.1 site-specific integrase [Streptomyces sp. PH10-H1]MDJ0372979.1 site-specific integrase [Streptomyces sp. H10-C2]
MKEPIRKITHKDGRTRYRLVVDIGDDAAGKRQQLTRTYNTKKEALSELSRIRHEVHAGTFVAPARTTVNAWLDTWLKSAIRDVEEATAANYEDALRAVRTHLGDKELQQLLEADIESLIDWMLTAGRIRGGKRGTGLGIRSVRLTLGRLRAALNVAVRRQLIVRNVAEHVTIPRQAREAAQAMKAGREPWTEKEVVPFLRQIATDRLQAPMLLLLLGLRPAEVCGLRWSDVDLETGIIAVAETRTNVETKVVVKAPKTAAGKRKLPMPSIVLVALKAFHATQAKEKLAAGAEYAASGRVVVDEFGGAVKTDWLRRRCYKLMEAAKVRRVRPYDARHACLTWLAASGVPDVVVSAWAGHSDLSFTKRVYVHPNTEHLRVAADHMDKVLGQK